MSYVLCTLSILVSVSFCGNHFYIDIIQYLKSFQFQYEFYWLQSLQYEFKLLECHWEESVKTNLAE